MGGRGIGGHGRWGQWGWNGRTNWMKRSLNLTKGPTIHVSASKAPASLSSLCSLTPSPQLLVVVACQGSCYITQTWWLFCVQQSLLLEPPASNLRYRINLGPVSTSLVARTYYWFYKLTTQLWCSHLNNHLHYYFYKFYKFGVLSSHAQRPPCHCRGSLARPTYQSYFRLSTLPSPPPSTIPTSAINSLPHSYCVKYHYWNYSSKNMWGSISKFVQYSIGW